MARVTHVMKARKDVAGTDIKKGESYYWWKFKNSGKRFSKTPPRRSQLTQSAFYSAVFDLEDDVIANAQADESLQGLRDDVVLALQEIGEQCQESLDNMLEGLQQCSTGELLQERIDAMDSAVSEFENLELEEWEATKGSDILGEHHNKDGKCKACGEEDFHTLDCEFSDKEAQVDDEDKTEQEYWDEKLEEFNAITIEAP